MDKIFLVDTLLFADSLFLTNSLYNKLSMRNKLSKKLYYSYVVNLLSLRKTLFAILADGGSYMGPSDFVLRNHQS